MLHCVWIHRSYISRQGIVPGVKEISYYRPWMLTSKVEILKELDFCVFNRYQWIQREKPGCMKSIFLYFLRENCFLQKTSKAILYITLVFLMKNSKTIFSRFTWRFVALDLNISHLHFPTGKSTGCQRIFKL